MKRILAALLASLLGMAAATAQDIYVDPVNGDDVANSGGVSDPFKTLTHAMSVATAGANVHLLSGTYSAATNGETFPIALKNQVDVFPDVGMSPDFDGGGAGTLFTIAESITALTTVKFFRAGNCDKVFSYGGTTGLTVKGLVVEDTLCDTFTSVGIEIVAGAGTDNQIVVRNCTLVGDAVSPPRYGVRVGALGSGTVLLGGGVEDCTITDCETGVLVVCVSGGDVNSLFQVRRNRITDSTFEGILIDAAPSASDPARNDCGVKGNIVTANGTGYGIHLSATRGLNSAQAASIGGSIEYNLCQGCSWALNLVTNNDPGSGAAVDITSVFTGNVFAMSTVGGVIFQAVNPQAGAANMAPVFGDGVIGGRNTFNNPGVPEWVYQTGMENVAQVKAQRNFWTGLGSTTAILADMDYGAAAPPDVSSPLADSLILVPVPQQVPENQAVTIQVNAGAGSAFVHNDDPDAIFGTLQAWLDGTAIQVFPSADGSFFTFLSPIWTEEATHNLLVLNPGGQGGNASLFSVSGGGGGGGGTGLCVVATAAHGDYDAPEVRVLRRFRDDYLLTNEAGRSLTAAYYEHGPPVAAFIAEHEWARRATRAALALPVAVSDALLTWSRAGRLLAGTLLLGAAFLLLRRRV